MSTGYSPMRRWLREERVRDAANASIMGSICTSCGRWLYKMDARGNLIGSVAVSADGRERECGSCNWMRTSGYVHSGA